MHVGEELLERLWSIGPRHMTGSLPSRKNPIDMSLSPSFTGGTIISSTATGF